MSYYTGMVAAVPTANRDRYRDHAAATWPILASHGAARMVETWGVDVPRGKINDFHGAVLAQDDETVVFSWIAWPDRATADAAWDATRSDPRMTPPSEWPFDGSRMIYGGFSPVLETGAPGGAGYYQGFLLAVPDANRSAYVAMAGQAWEMFRAHGARGLVETWGQDVPRGSKTDMYRATLAEDGEVPLFSWIAWPDRATCDAAGAAMQAEMTDQDMAAMPFDGKRMIWAGFEPIFESEQAD